MTKKAKKIRDTCDQRRLVRGDCSRQYQFFAANKNKNLTIAR